MTPQNAIHYYLTQYWDDIADPRTANLPLIKGGIWKILAIMLTYITISRIILPRVMRHRKAFDLRHPMLVYNVIMVIANGLLFIEAVKSCEYGSVFLDFKYPSQNDRTPHTLRLLQAE